MKKTLLITLCVLMSVAQLFANPVDVKTAQSIGENYVRNNLYSLRNFQNSKHVLTLNDDKGNACLYIFNIEDKGYYIMAADDRAKPVLAYSDEGVIDVNNIPSSMMYYLDHYKNAISYAIENNLEAELEIKEEWNLVRNRGVVVERNLGKSVEPLIDLLWNQVYPYNYFCPTEKGGTGGHAQVGCAADVMAMLMKYWDYPEAGTGKHSYIPEGYPIQTVDFGATTYDWDNMPQQIFSSSPIQEIEAIALLMYHCGVSIDMKYGPAASSGYSEMVPSAMSKYFRYTDKMRHFYREDYERTDWEDMLIENFDQGFPVFYAGTSPMSGGHAFVCDGYTEDRYFHFNWGWSGISNGNFAIDALSPTGADYSVNQRAIFDFIPDYAYNIMPKAPVVETETMSVYSRKGLVKITAPTESESGTQIESIDKIVVLRNNQEVYSESNVTPGTTLVFEDEVDDFDIYNYSVYAVSDGIYGRRTETSLLYGSTCSWNIIASTNSFQGWNGASLQILSGEDTFDEITVTGSTPVNIYVQMPEGEVSFVWNAPKSPLSSLTIKIKNASDDIVYEYTGPSSGLAEGVLYSGNNNCENCRAPENLSAEFTVLNDESGVMVSWDKVDEPQSYKVYRSLDNENYEEIATVASSENKYFDVNNESGVYYYQVTSYNTYCESMPAATADHDADYIMIEVVSLKENVIDAKIYPNPVNDRLNIIADGVNNVSIYNVMGQKVLENNVEADMLSLDVSGLKNGLYMLEVSSRKGVVTQSITIAR